MDELQALILLIVAIGLGVIGRYLVKFMDAKTSKTKDSNVKIIMEQARDFINQIVDSYQQTIVNDLKKNGKLDEKTAINVKESAMETTKKWLSDKHINIASEYMGGAGAFDDFIDKAIEARVLENKQKKK